MNLSNIYCNSLHWKPDFLKIRFRSAKVLLLLYFVVIPTSMVSCGSLGSEYFSHNLSENEKLMPSLSKVEYFNGRLNFVMSFASNNNLFLNINGRLFKLGNSSLERVLLSSITNNYGV
ncbi:MAG: hypothetical protein N2712_07945, partial [Brevinematales bacterium]|nr:hypothetical protein [Brevinematales bacterium]